MYSRMPLGGKLLERILAAAITLPVLYFLTPANLSLAFIALGQGHFVSTYIYQARAGKLSRRYIQSYLIIAILLFGAWSSQAVDYKLLQAFTSLYFMAHFLFDESFLAGELAVKQRLPQVLPPFIAYAGFILEGHWGYPVITPAIAISALLAVAGFRYSSSPARPYFLLLLAIVYSIFITGSFRGYDNLVYLMATPILYHYAHWYLHYLFRYIPDRTRLSHYMTTILAVNAVLIITFFIWRLSIPYSGWLGILFSPNYFYLWTILHITFATRPQEIGYFAKSSLK